MNDRFKFRAYNKELRKMYEVDTICPYEDSYTKGGEVFLKGIQFNSFYFPEEVEVMQCTGLKDKNGKLIYEGDVVTYDWLTPISKVWRTDGKHIVEWQDGFTVIGNIAGYDVKHGKSRNVEVIGNIYENKELLESEV